MPASIGIVGGGIGGLTAAIALRARGFDVTVFERAERRGSEGIALLLWANAVRDCGTTPPLIAAASAVGSSSVVTLRASGSGVLAGTVTGRL